MKRPTTHGECIKYLVENIQAIMAAPSEVKTSFLSTIETINAYVTTGRPTGSFVRAVLENNLKLAFAFADAGNTFAMHAIVAYVYNFVPSICWGTEGRVREWLEMSQSNRDPLIHFFLQQEQP